MTIRLILTAPGSTQSLEFASGSVIEVGPGTLVQFEIVQPIGIASGILDPRSLDYEIVGDDVIVRLPNGEQVTLENYLESLGSGATSLADAAGEMVVASPEDLVATAAGGTPEVPPEVPPEVSPEVPDISPAAGPGAVAPGAGAPGGAEGGGSSAAFNATGDLGFGESFGEAGAGGLGGLGSGPAALPFGSGANPNLPLLLAGGAAAVPPGSAAPATVTFSEAFVEPGEAAAQTPSLIALAAPLGSLQSFVQGSDFGFGIPPATLELEVSPIGETRVELLGGPATWNNVKNVDLSDPDASQVTIVNFVQADVSLGDGGDSSLTLTGAKRGQLATGDGDDVIAITVFTDATVGFTGFEIATGPGDDTVSIVNNATSVANNSIAGGSGNDSITVGGATASNDIINGEAGDDVLAGGLGNDQLTGGSGSDSFVFAIGEIGNSQVLDFSLAEDSLTFTGVGGGDAAALDALATVTDNGASTTVAFAGGARIEISGAGFDDFADFEAQGGDLQVFA